MENTVTAEQIGVRELLEAGVHFGHQARRWNPKMKRYIFAERAGVHIIDLDQTLTLLDRGLAFLRDVSAAGREVLFVGTKKQAQLTIAEQAMRSGQPYVAERYIGGMLTNFQTIRPRIQHFVTLAAAVDETPEEARTGREWFALHREYQKLRRNFAGITEMDRLPGAVFVVDPKREELMVKEANRLRIPVVALTDTNCDPDVIDYVIPGNDDAIRSINMITKLVANAILAGGGEDAIPNEERPIPPAVEEAMVSTEVVDQSERTERDAITADAESSFVQTPADRPAASETGAEGASGESTNGNASSESTNGSSEISDSESAAGESVGSGSLDIEGAVEESETAEEPSPVDEEESAGADENSGNEETEES